MKGIPGQGVRRWFNDARLDLFVWYDADGSIIGFQLCFDKDTHTECALTFTEDKGYSFDQVTGETSVCDIGSLVLSRAGEFSRPSDRATQRTGRGVGAFALRLSQDETGRMPAAIVRRSRGS